MFGDSRVVDRISSILESKLLLHSSKIRGTWSRNGTISALVVCSIKVLNTWYCPDRATRATRENGFLEVVLRSNNSVYPEMESLNQMALETMADPDSFDDRERVVVGIEPEECFLFAERLLHRSPESSSGPSRIEVSSRVTVPFVSHEPAGGYNSVFMPATAPLRLIEHISDALAKSE